MPSVTAAIAALILAASAAAIGCGTADPGGGDSEGLRPPAEIPASREMTILSRFRLQSQANELFGTPLLRESVWVGSFVYTRCTRGCEMVTARLAELQGDLAGRDGGEQIRFVTFTLDPANDKVAVLAEYAEKAGFDPVLWSFLTGPEKILSALYREAFDLPADGGATTLEAHSHEVFVVDRARRIRGRYDILDGEGLAALKQEIDAALVDPIGVIVDLKPPPWGGAGGERLFEPPDIQEPSWLAARAAAQAAALPEHHVFTGFRFEDRLPASGITFVNRVVDDAAKSFQRGHYQNGNGIAVADVDGDGLIDIYFTSQLGGSQLWRNLGGGRFEEITEAAGVAASGRVGVSASFADTDNDGDPDLYVTSVRGGNLLFENDGRGRFTDVTASSGLGYAGHSSSALFFDYDRDGLLDLFLANVGIFTTDESGPGHYFVGLEDAFKGHQKPEREERSILFRNLGGNRFADVSAPSGLEEKGWAGAAGTIDLNEDGFQDLYILSMQGHDEYWENVEGKRFTRKSREIFPRSPWGSTGIQVLDFDNDGRMDIYLTDMSTDMLDDIGGTQRYWYAEKLKMSDLYPDTYLMTDGNHVRGNAFFHNLGNGAFREVSDSIGAESYWPWGMSAGDLNADGWTDVFITAGMGFPYRYAVNSLLLNNRGTAFVDSEFVLGVEPRRDRRTSTPWFTLECGGADRAYPGCRSSNGAVAVEGALSSRSSAIFDLEGDGDLDIVTNDFNSAPMLLVSDLSERSPGLHWLKIRLEGTASNREGLGARVTVRAGGERWTKVHDGQSGYLSQSLVPLYFGLGNAGSVDGVEVRWPSGKRQRLAGPLEANRLLTITEE
jgi:cytochrome oxidase Cu insertion factor (SCO1/SenC/PrrC family)